jgi:PAS domain S-box-containing protein
MKEALRHSEDKYRQIFENLPDVYFELSLDGRLLEISPSIEKFSGYRRPALLGTSMRELCADPVECVRFEQALASAGQVKDFELTMLNHNRTVEYCSISAQCTSEAEDGVSKIVGFLRVDSHRKRTDMEQYGYKMRLEELVRERTADWEKSNQQLRAEVENRLQKENELRWSETKYRTIIESLENGYYEVDRQGNLTFFNRALCQLLGHSPQETAGLNLRRYLEPFTGQQLPEIFRNLPAPDVESVTTLCYLSSKAGRRRTVEISVTPMFDTHQQVAGARGLVQDITDRIDAETEKKKLEERFHQIQRLEGIGTLAGGVAHDFNNLMMGIQGNVSLILMETDKVSPHYERLKNIEANVHTGAELTRKLLGFARGGKYVVKPTDLNQLVSNSARLFGRTRKEINVVEKLQPDAWSAKVDGSQIELVLFNLLINAWQAMPDGGNIYLETENVNLPEGPAYSLNIPAGRYVRISIADTGTGMDEPTQKRIFEPFFTTKDLGRGTGLGLASAYGIAKNHGGAIDFTSVLGQGTIFYLYLPAYADAMSMESAPIAAAQATGSSLVLLVDDEGMILKTGRWMLEKLGYQVLAAQSGVEAVTLFSEHHREIALVILDLVMPEMDGQALFHRLRQIDSSVKVLISSGYDRNEKIEELLSRGGAEFIQKPFNIQYLGAKLSEMIGPRS